MVSKRKLARMVDHTNLHTDAAESDIERLCQEAIDSYFGAVCVRSDWVQYAHFALRNYDVNIASVVGFSIKKCLTEKEMIEELSQYSTDDKIRETELAIKQGANEIDMVIDLRAMKNGDYDAVEKDIRAVVTAAGDNIVKVIIETCYLTNREIVLATGCVEGAGAHYVKTSTGYGEHGAREEDVRLIAQRLIKPATGIKAAGGIATIEEVRQFYKVSQDFGTRPFRAGASGLAKDFRLK